MIIPMCLPVPLLVWNTFAHRDLHIHIYLIVEEWPKIDYNLSMNAETNIEDLISTAEEVDEKYQISKLLELADDSDIQLLRLYLEQRLLKADIYHTSWFLSTPGAIVMARIPGISYLIKFMDASDKADRQKLSKLEEVLTSLPSDKLRARTIELAINDLVANATCQNTPTHKIPEFLPTELLLEDWSKRWKDKLKTKP